MQIRFDYDKNNRKVAYRWSDRWIRMSLAKAELLESTSQAQTVYYGPNTFKPGKFTFTTLREINGMKVIQIEKVAE